ncbi:methionine--tRNA ligase subunit beta [Terriglobus saanensis]|uniref:Methionine--tRNA ligase n=1 Tax=Terriglobus saanensis (strain ATCC BAA-1853 / DSM 23119 / SP1PR4) TaxID=401053 RepID=E8UZZ7_TERSS|nr:methionine--tRNA ligase subunit beta [Terriglobus saanensis]ADV82152.1 methionyl-tRNA synthetase [Terriglobus saanensis SP1PR4]
MPNKKDKFYLTTPIYYVNARPHIGHAYTTLTADTIARRKRLQGFDTYFLTGTDEHGQKIQRSAEAAGIPPQQFADQVSEQFRALWDRMGVTYDQYIRTTDEAHKRGAQKLFTTLYERGFIELRSYTGQYSIGEEMFVEGPPGTIGPDGKLTETVTEENFFFKLSEFQTQLIDLIGSNELEITPEARKNEVLSFLRGNVNDTDATAVSAAGHKYIPGALRDLSISRSSFTWGIPVPEIVAGLTEQKHVIYVWLDALANYMTAVGYGSDDPADIAKFEKYWPADLHIVGKEITRFHCVYWPAFLLAAGLPLPKKIVAHGWLLFEESKMSKSRGNIVRSETILEGFGSIKPDLPKAEQDLFAADVLRYFLLREIPFGQDGSFSFDAMVTRYNADLANGYGNLVSRTLSMVEKNFGGVLPAPSDEIPNGEFETLAALIDADFDTQTFTRATTSIAQMITNADRFFSEAAPWKLAKEEASREKFGDVLYRSAESIRTITALLYPILPYATAQVWRQLGLGDIEQAAKNGELNNLHWGGLKPGTKLGPLAPIFPRADKEIITRMTDLEQSNKPAAAPEATPETKTVTDPMAQDIAPPADTVVAEQHKPITIDDFAKIELRVGQIKIAERIPKADKLLRLEVDLGTETRQILSGIAEWYTPEDLVGRRIVVITNLAPRKMRGLESHGMLLAASEGENGKPVLATFSEEIALGSRLK